MVYARPQRRFRHVRHQRNDVDDCAMFCVWFEKHLDTVAMAGIQPGFQYDVSYLPFLFAISSKATVLMLLRPDQRNYYTPGPAIVAVFTQVNPLPDTEIQFAIRYRNSYRTSE